MSLGAKRACVQDGLGAAGSARVEAFPRFARSGMVEETDVFIIGGGPARLAAAIATRRKGFRVTVADGAEPPIDKACGEGLLPDTAAASRELGVIIHGSDGST